MKQNCTKQELIEKLVLKNKFKNNKNIVSIRSMGLMIGIELKFVKVVIQIEKKLLINVTSEKVIRLLPPLIINETEAKVLCERLINVIEVFLNNYE